MRTSRAFTCAETATSFCPRRRTGRSEFSTRLLGQRPIYRSSPRPMPLSATAWDRRRSVTMLSGRTYRFIDFFRNFSAALGSLDKETKLSSAPP